MQNLDLVGNTNIDITEGTFVFSTNPTMEDLKQVEAAGKILVVYSKDIKKCIEFRERLGESCNLSIWLDQSPIKMYDGRELDFKEFFLSPYLEVVKKGIRLF